MFGEKGREYFLERFEFEHFYRTILDIYGQVLTAGSRANQKPLA
jgi:hypothetical protein